MRAPLQSVQLRLRDLAGLAGLAAPLAGASIAVSAIGAVWWILALHLASAREVGLFAATFGLGTVIAEIGNLGVGYTFIRYARTTDGPALIRTGMLMASACVALVSAALIPLSFVASHLFSIQGGASYFLFILLGALSSSWFVATDDLLVAT